MRSGWRMRNLARKRKMSGVQNAGVGKDFMPMKTWVIEMNLSNLSRISRFIPACSWHRTFHECDEGEKRILGTRGRRSNINCRRRLI